MSAYIAIAAAGAVFTLCGCGWFAVSRRVIGVNAANEEIALAMAWMGAAGVIFACFNIVCEVLS